MWSCSIDKRIGIILNHDGGILFQKEFRTAILQYGLFDDLLLTIGVDNNHQLSLVDIGNRHQLRTLTVFGQSNCISVSRCFQPYRPLACRFCLAAGGITVRGGITAGGAVNANLKL